MASTDRHRREEYPGRYLLVSACLLLLAALLFRYHLVPAKNRLQATQTHYYRVQQQLEELRESNQELHAEREALLHDPMYSERLRRRVFRKALAADEIVLKEYP